VARIALALPAFLADADCTRLETPIPHASALSSSLKARSLSYLRNKAVFVKEKCNKDQRAPRKNEQKVAKRNQLKR